MGGLVDTKTRSVKEAQARLSRTLRSDGKTWAEVAEVFRDEYSLNARVALRLARGWSQADAAREWNRRWPDDPKTFKNFSYWEQWPSPTGYMPSLDVLSRLAELYECHAADLLADAADHRENDPMYRSRVELQRLPVAVAGRPGHAHNGGQSDGSNGVSDLAVFVKRLEDSDVHELAEVTAGWAQQIDASVDRRSLLLKLSFALTLAAAGPVVGLTDGAEAHTAPAAGVPQLGGIWRSEYSYFSSGRQQEYSDLHFVLVRQKGQQLTVESLPHSNGSELGMNLTVDGLTATGSWEERTSPTGYYKGAVYRGAIQLLAGPAANQMIGKWLGFGNSFTINTGDWRLTLETRSTAPKAISAYSLKV
jgi:hypothetical protein